jgi:hypothetical protein
MEFNNIREKPRPTLLRDALFINLSPDDNIRIDLDNLQG